MKTSEKLEQKIKKLQAEKEKAVKLEKTAQAIISDLNFQKNIEKSVKGKIKSLTYRINHHAFTEDEIKGASIVIRTSTDLPFAKTKKGALSKAGQISKKIERNTGFKAYVNPFNVWSEHTKSTDLNIEINSPNI